MSLKDWETKPNINTWVEFVWAVEGTVEGTVEAAKKNRATWFKPPVVGIGIIEGPVAPAISCRFHVP